MNTSNKIAKRSMKRKSSFVEIPYLNRVRIISLDIKNTPVGNNLKLRGKISRNIQLGLIENSNPDSSQKTAIRLEVEVDGVWKDVETDDVIITYKAKYAASFLFAKGVDDNDITHWMEDPIYRDGVIAQAIPSIHQHLYAQMDMMGLNQKSRTLGLTRTLDLAEAGA